MIPIGGLVKLQFLKEILVSRFWSLFMAEPLKGSALRILLVASSNLVSRFLIANRLHDGLVSTVPGGRRRGK